jgi:hypothetical protein
MQSRLGLTTEQAIAGVKGRLVIKSGDFGKNVEITGIGCKIPICKFAIVLGALRNFARI